jgi:hypothetical protein
MLSRSLSGRASGFEFPAPSDLVPDLSEGLPAAAGAGAADLRAGNGIRRTTSSGSLASGSTMICIVTSRSLRFSCCAAALSESRHSHRNAAETTPARMITARRGADKTVFATLIMIATPSGRSR